VILTFIPILAHCKSLWSLIGQTLNNLSQIDIPCTIEEFPLFFYNKIK
jgi:hypothetical protein